jgi:hypothetical protein
MAAETARDQLTLTRRFFEQTYGEALAEPERSWGERSGEDDKHQENVQEKKEKEIRGIQATAGWQESVA